MLDDEALGNHWLSNKGTSGVVLSDEVFRVIEIKAIDLAEDVRARLSFAPLVNVVDQTGSTNADLMADPHTCHQQVLIAMHQHSGAGRRGSQWASPLGGNLYLSAGWHFGVSLRRVAVLPLIVAARVADEIESLLPSAIQLKWPNDLFCDGKKFGGILVESQTLSDGVIAAVIGVGINVNTTPAEVRVHRPITSLSEQTGALVDLQAVAEAVTLGIFLACQDVASSSTYDWHGAWSKRDLLLGRQVTLDSPTLSGGVVRGLSEDGGLRVEHQYGIETLYAGEVSLGALEQ